jgi:lipopolysaccharide/colanic/teichoic acid biosynthesis glycosyltransferase
MYKFRTMHVAASGVSAITAQHDTRVFAFGRLLRRLKLDELPQLFNVLRGDMAIVGPRPEDLRIVEAYYAPAHLETLTVRPGLASPGSIYNYTHGERIIGNEDPERDYIERLLPVKLALDRVYVRNASLGYDIRIIGRTLCTIFAISAGRKEFAPPPEMGTAQALIKPASQGSVRTRNPIHDSTSP